MMRTQAAAQSSNSHSTTAVYFILRKYSSPQSPLTRADVIRRLEEDYGIRRERKAVSRSLEALAGLGVPIISLGRRGVYLDRTGELGKAHWRLILSALRSASFIPESDIRQIEARLKKALPPEEYRAISSSLHARPDRSQSPSVLRAMDLIDEAVQGSRPLRFRYIDFYWDGKPVWHDDPPAERLFLPYFMYWQMDRCYVYGDLVEGDPRYVGSRNPSANERAFRIDRMYRPAVQEEKRRKRRVDPEEIIRTRMQAFSGKTHLVTLALDRRGMQMAVDRFGSRAADGISAKAVEDPAFPYRYSFPIVVSPVFFGWLSQLQDRTESGIRVHGRIVSPDSVRKEYLAWLESLYRASSAEI